MGYRALYRKYRPRLFADIVGQPGIVQALTGQVEADRISHAYLFSGPRGTGKTSAAKVLARAINCRDNRRGEACGECRACVELSSEANLDIIEIDAASNNSVDKVREMLENVKFMPAIGRFRVYIVDEVHMLSASAFNALLKTLEEPPAHVVFILATTEPNKLPATVLSRCQQFQFRRITATAMVNLLKDVLAREGAQADDDALSLIARASDGGMRDALSLLDQCLSLTDAPVTRRQVQEMLGTADSGFFFDVADALLGGDAGAAVERLDAFLAAGGDIKTFAVDLCRHMRDLYIASYASNAAATLDVTEDEAALYRAQAARHAPGDILRALGFLAELEGSLRYAANPRIPVELALFRCCRAEKHASYDALLTRVEKLESALASGAATQKRGRHAAASGPPSLMEKEEDAAGPVPEEGRGTTATLFDSDASGPPWEEETGADAVPDDAAYSAETLENQASLFDGPVREEDPPTPARPQSAPPLAAPSAAPDAGSAPKDAHSQQAKRLWQNVIAAVERKQPNLTGYVKRGRGVSLEGGVLTISFTQDDGDAVEKLETARWKERLQSVASGVAGHAVSVAFTVSRWTEENLDFIDRSRASIPKGIPVEIDFE